MADLKEVRSSNRTAERGRLFHCTVAKGKKRTCVVVCSCQDLNKIVHMCCSCNSYLSLNISWPLNHVLFYRTLRDAHRHVSVLQI